MSKLENKINLTKLEDVKILPVVEEIHIRGNLKFNPKNLIIKTTNNKIFNFIILADKSKNILYIYGSPFKKISEILKKETLVEGVLDEETFTIVYKVIGTNPKILKIDTTEKDYCIEMILKDEDVIKLNFITTNPKKGCKINDKGCQSLDFLFREIFSFLEQISYKGEIFLEDDSMSGNDSLHLFRLFKGDLSIYCKYGFRYSDEANKIIIQPILKFLKDNNLINPKLEEINKSYLDILNSLVDKFNFKIISKVPMINLDYKKYLDTCNFEKPKSCILEEKKEKESYNFGDSLPMSLEIEEIKEENLQDRLNLYLTNLQKINGYDFEGLKIYRDLVLINQDDLLDFIKEDPKILKLILVYISKILNNFDLKLKNNPLMLIKKENVDDRLIKSKILENKELLSDILLFLEKLEMFNLVLLICDEIVKY